MSLPVERLETLSMLPGEVVIIIDDAFRIVGVSPSVTPTLGYAPEDFTGGTGLHFIHPDDRDLVAGTWLTFGDDPDRVIRYEIRARHASGMWRWVEIIARDLRHDPAVGFFLLNFRDVTERRHAQDALVASEERFRALVQNTSDVVLILNEDLTISYASPSLAANLEVDPADILGTSALAYIHPDDRDHVAYALLPVFKPAGTADACFRTPRPDGEWHEVEATCVNLLDDPHVHGIVCNIRDVSETRAAQEALAASEQRIRALVQHSDNIIEILDADATITWVSPACEQIVGWRVDDLIGHPAGEFAHPDDLAATMAPFRDALGGPLGTSARGRGRVRRRDGSWVWLECVFTNRFDDPAIGGIIGNFRDISAQVEAEDSLRDSERLFRSLAESSPNGIYRQDNDNNCVFVNERWTEITGLTLAEAYGHGWRRMVHPDDVAATPGADDIWPDPGRPLQYMEFRVVRPDGAVRWVVARSAPMLGEDGVVIGRVGTISDITERMDARRDAQRLTDIFEATHDLVGIADAKGNLLYVNQAAREFFGLPDDGTLDAMLLRSFTRRGGGRVVGEIRAALEREGMWSGELVLTNREGVEVPVLAQLLSHNDAEGNFEFFSGVAHDISQRKAFESQLAHQATHDPLTGLPNRVLLLERLQFALERARRTGKRVAVLFLDLDHFKVVNDSLGHGVGDVLLKSIAERLKTVVRPGDTIARFGGDEFVVLCEDLVTRTDATAVADRVNDVISGPFTVGDAEVFVGVSIGIAFPDDPDAEAGTLIRDADAAMYRAKARGRARWEVFDNAMRASAVDRLDIENALRRAQERRELRVFYQPIISLATGAIEGVEALIRWEHPERGLLLPNEFIHVAEETGLIVPMGAWVLEQSCRQIMRWQASLPNLAPLRLSVNLSSRQLGHATLVPNVRSIIADTHIDPSRVELEITESVLMDDVEMSHETLGQLKSLGVKLVVDDFGTGYSSLSYLRRFPVDVLKVDRSFVNGLGHDPSDSAIVTAIVTLAHTLGLSAVAEGIETADQLAELRRLRCDYGQGFLMARPTPAHDIGELLARRPRW